MKIILTSIGTRGDIEPFLAIGKILKEKEHQVICAFSEQFRELTESCDIEFASLGRKNDDVLESDANRTVMGGSGIKKFFAYIKLMKLAQNKKVPQEKEFKLYELVQQERPDRIVYHSKNVYPLLWEYENRGKTIFVSPFAYFHYIKGHSFFVGKNYGEFFNKLTFKFSNFGVVTATMAAKKWLQIKDKITRRELKNIIHSRKFIYTISPSLFPRPGYWESNIKVLGHQQLKRKTDWKPEKKLTEFIEKYEKILFITFGSMPNPEPKQKTKIILEILERNKIPAIINTASGGLVKPDKFNSELIYFVSQISYDWIFPKMYAVIQHGGAGTTHLAIKYGCATMIIPHFMDQFVWDKISFDMGVGPKGIKISRITNKNLEPKVLELLNNRSFKEKSEKLGNQMKKENFKDELYKTITNN
ncbi:MAG: glycosyltransferase [Anaerolineae bacterium]|jgi:UDP:flavonoid glycosyltransferase YjiC (YdhE family)|nr:glycosyltransferase [Anaerolineae bacterium]MBT4456701.1 glycosyltransferase [Anaerolineae bacterium]MBT6062085.1 glycosyltransferase [Anaerolineae bacterium]MBT6321001.1 glycosyltransferase [Anaerolineae bacterium]MBT6813221.1 glycosyltransferase [Anaerolineae bacterium]